MKRKEWWRGGAGCLLQQLEDIIIFFFELLKFQTNVTTPPLSPRHVLSSPGIGGMIQAVGAGVTAVAGSVLW